MMVFYRIAQKQYFFSQGAQQYNWAWCSALYGQYEMIRLVIHQYYRHRDVLIFGATSVDGLENALQDFNAGEVCMCIKPVDFLAGVAFDERAIQAWEDEQAMQRATKSSDEGLPRRLEFYRWLVQVGRLTEWPYPSLSSSAEQ